MYIIERRRTTSNFDDFESTEIVESAYIENEHFEQAIKREIDKFKQYGFIEPNLKEGEILRIEHGDLVYRWVMWDYQDDMAPFMFLASASQPDDFTDTILNIRKWMKDIEEHGYVEPKERETKNTDYIIA